MDIMKQFEKYKNDVGFGMAVVICKDDLPQDFYRSLNFEQWKDVCEHTPEEDSFYQTAIEGAYKLAGDFNQYGEVKDLAPKGSKCEEAASRKRLKTAETIEQYIQVDNEAPYGSQLRADARKEIDKFFI